MRKFEGVKFFSSFDLTSGYWQIPLNKNAQKYTGFMFDGRSFVFKVMAFGDATAVASFTRAMILILGPEILEFVSVYLDDFLVTSNGNQ